MTGPGNGSPEPPLSRRRAPVRYAAALALSVVAVLLTMAARDLLTSSPFLLFFPAIIGAAWIGGLGPALVVIASALLAADVWYLKPLGRPSVPQGRDALWLATFALVASAVGVIAAKLVDARAEAQLANDAKSRFLAVMSHELRTPLNAILGYSDLLSSGVGGEINAVQANHVARIRDSVLHLRNLIDRILSLSRIEAGREELNVTEFDVAVLVRAAVEMSYQRRRSVTSKSTGGEASPRSRRQSAGWESDAAWRPGQTSSGRAQPVVERGQVHRARRDPCGRQTGRRGVAMH